MTKSICIECILTVALLGSVANAQAGRAVSSIPVVNVRFNDRTMNILVEVATRYQVVIGIYGVLVGSDSRRVNIALQSGTLKDLLDAMSDQDPRFEWREVRDGIVHVTVRDSPLLLADVTVSSFEAEKPERSGIVDLLSQIPEVKMWLSQQSCYMDEIFVGPPPKGWKPFAVHAQNEPFSRVLDAIAMNSQTYFWSAIQFSKEPCAINVRP